MRYLLILDEHLYENFEKVDGNPLEIYAIDQNGNKRMLDLRPIKTEMVVMPDGSSVYITPDHIHAMVEYEREQCVKDICERINRNFDGINSVIFDSTVDIDLHKIGVTQYGAGSLAFDDMFINLQHVVSIDKKIKETKDDEIHKSTV